ncbi:hypothetical protein Tco_1066226 [Tanacetum coccineum]|uniref:Uncharacterized protein n=1 Tax=Tanacetum coccineum TaxID=301880 RepID=A0ABQ5HAP0_9ASTR
MLTMILTRLYVRICIKTSLGRKVDGHNTVTIEGIKYKGWVHKLGDWKLNFRKESSSENSDYSYSSSDERTLEGSSSDVSLSNEEEVQKHEPNRQQSTPIIHTDGDEHNNQALDDETSSSSNKNMSLTECNSKGVHTHNSNVEPPRTHRGAGVRQTTSEGCNCFVAIPLRRGAFSLVNLHSGVLGFAEHQEGALDFLNRNKRNVFPGALLHDPIAQVRRERPLTESFEKKSCKFGLQCTSKRYQESNVQETLKDVLIEKSDMVSITDVGTIVIGKVCDLTLIENLHQLCHKEGFLMLKLSTLEALWLYVRICIRTSFGRKVDGHNTVTIEGIKYKGWVHKLGDWKLNFHKESSSENSDCSYSSSDERTLEISSSDVSLRNEEETSSSSNKNMSLTGCNSKGVHTHNSNVEVPKDIHINLILDAIVDNHAYKDHSMKSSSSKPPGFEYLQTQQMDHMEPNNDQIPRASFSNFVDSAIKLIRDQSKYNSNNTLNAKYCEDGLKLGFNSQGCAKKEVLDYGPRPFQFLNSWLEEHDFHNFLVVNFFKNQNIEKTILKEKLKDVGNLLDLGIASTKNIEENNLAKSKLYDIEKKEVLDMAQKAKIK